MADFLALMAAASTTRASQAKQKEPESALRHRALDRADPPSLQLHPGKFDLIAEVKRHAPSAGALVGVDANDPDLVARQADAYVRGGVAAVSVLTEPSQFLGTLADVTSASRAVPVPVLRKDFLVDPYQVVEARAAGAGGVLLIVRMHDDTRLGELLEAAKAMRLFVLLEAFDEDDLARAAENVADGMGNVLLGLNTRNLATLQVDSDRLDRLSHVFPEHTPRVAESGLESVEDIRRVARLGYRLALVGSALMRATDPTRLAETMIRAGRKEARKLWASV